MNLRPIGNRSLIGCGQVVLSIKMGDFVDRKMFLRSPSRKKAVFLDETLFSGSASKKMGVFLASKVADKKETPSKGCLCNYFVMRSPIRSGMTSLPA